ncbi:MAG: exodeoxyribonuclease I [Chromatiaceae bacterium]|jgi:exodeoxyribonuclease-1|nr:exodeoxyribonuclease I [Chromatiaceae bacterium]
MSEPRSFYWHDYETWGAQPAVDRPAQFAGLRTDADFNPVGEPLVIYARPADDFLPQPEACLITGITPQLAREKGAPEADFFRFIHAELARPGTCALGYNSLRFDDEVTRYGLYRNFFDPYAREWQNGNSRWDMIDVVRLTRALRPDGIEWPEREPGVTSFRLEDLTAANDIEHSGAHDALADVRATIALARLVRARQPKLFDFVLHNRDKQKLAAQLNVRAWQPVLHVSARYPASRGCIAAVLPLAMHPVNRNGVIVYDLRADPGTLLELSADEIRARLYTASADLPDGVERIPLKVVHINRAPVIVPMGTITAAAREQWQMDAAAEQRHIEALRAAPGLAAKLAAVFDSAGAFPAQSDPDRDLYGGFLSEADRRLCEQVRGALPAELATLHPGFEAPKLHELLFRYRARNWPETLDRQERLRWEEFRRERLTQPGAGASIVLDDYRRQLSRLAVDLSLTAAQRAVIDALLDWPEELGI